MPWSWQATPVIGSSHHLVVDIDGDGLRDIVWGLSGASTSSQLPGVVCLLSSPTGGLGQPILSTFVAGPGEGPSLIGAGDLDRDGNVDLVGKSQQGIRAFLGDGMGGFSAILPLPGTATGTRDTYHVDDLDGDGSPELIAAPTIANISQVWEVWHWTFGSIYWNQPQIYQFGLRIEEVATGDFDGNGLRDILTVPYGPIGPSGSILLLNQGMGTFMPLGPLPIAPGRNLAVADVDADGCDDVVNKSGGAGPVNVTRGSPAGLLPSVAQPFLGFLNTISLHLHSDDVDGDGMEDVLFVDQDAMGPGTVVDIYYARGGGLLSSPLRTLFPPDSFLGPVSELADVDGDGDRDLVFIGTQGPLGNPTTNPAGIAVALSTSILGPGAASGNRPVLRLGTATPGNPGFGIELTGAPPSAPAAMGISLQTGLLGTPAGGIWLDLSPGALLSPTDNGGFGVVTTDAFGAAVISLPLPNDPVLLGLRLHLQWAVLDQTSPFLVNGVPFSLSDARTIVVW